jgi:hypothetical protein
MSLELYTRVHVAISLVGIVSGLIVMAGLLAGKRLAKWTALFLAATAATSVTGFGFPFHKLLPAHIVGMISLLVLAVAIVARYALHLRGGWRKTYVITSVIALYLNVFVAVVQAFEKIPALAALAPKQNEPPFVTAQAAVLVLFIIIGVMATGKFRPAWTG